MSIDVMKRVALLVVVIVLAFTIAGCNCTAGSDAITSTICTVEEKSE